MTAEEILDEWTRIINSDIVGLEKGIARATYQDLSALARIQGRLEGLEQARNILTNLIRHANED